MNVTLNKHLLVGLLMVFFTKYLKCYYVLFYKESVLSKKQINKKKKNKKKKNK